MHGGGGDFDRTWYAISDQIVYLAKRF